MAWQIPAAAQWNPAGVPMAPDPSNMNMGSITPDQWTLMQQQNWHQWAQWQQQYAQWQTQYGEKFSKQMMQNMGVAPQPSAPLPAPLPPDKPPPPPPPHENDQPLYGTKPPAPSMPMQPYSANAGNSTLNTGNNQNWSHNADNLRNDTVQTPSTINNEALKKLAEEEHLFDIQFQKWEEEIEKWKKENVNHPDKRAYSEYEQKFEACRAQLLERRQQMNLKRAQLLGNVSNTASTVTAGNNITAPIQNANLKPNNQPNQISKPPQSYQHNNNTRHDYNRGNNKNMEPQDRYDSYVANESYTSHGRNQNYPPIENQDYTQVGAASSFFPNNEAPKGIPGLDLVPETEKAPEQVVVDITEEHREEQVKPKAPDYSTISQGINNILGDEKIMNILSMMQSRKPGDNYPNIGQENASANLSGPPTDAYQNQNDYYGRSEFNGTQQGSGYQNRHQQASNYDNRSQKYNIDNRSDDSGSYGNRPTPHNFDNRPPSNNFSIRPPPLMNFATRQPPHNFDTSQPPPNYDNMQNNTFHNRPQNSNYDKTNQQNANYQIKSNYQNNSQDAYEQGYNESNTRVNYDQYQGNVPPERRQGTVNRPAPRPLLEINPLMDNQMLGFDQRRIQANVNAPLPQKPTWPEEPLFTPSIIVEYEHQSLRLKAREFIEPVHTFDYDHKSKDEDIKRNFEKEVEELYTREPRTSEKENSRFSRDSYTRDYDRRPSKNVYDDYRQRPRDDPYPHRDDRAKTDNRMDDRSHDDRDRTHRRDDFRERDVNRDRDRDFRRDREREDNDFGRDRGSGRRDVIRDRDFGRERDYGRGRDNVRDRVRDIDSSRDRDSGRYPDKQREAVRSRSRDRDVRKRDHSVESEASNSSKKSKSLPVAMPQRQPQKHVVMIDDLLEEPGRSMRPQKIVIILRGPPGSGKSYLAKLIRDKEAEHGSTVRIMSIDDYFMQEGEIEEKDPTTGKTAKKPSLKYEYDAASEETYITSLKRAFKRSITDGYFSFLIFDAVNDQLKCYADMWNFGRQNGFQVYICTMDLDPQTCHKRNIHNRSLEDIENICARFFPTPAHHLHLDPTTLLQSAAITEVTMEDAVSMEDVQETEVENSFTSKWERMDDVNQLARLDGTSKPLRPKLSMEDYLQLDEWTPNKAKPGKKTVRWADIEESREQEKMRAIGFVVGQTDWNRMTDPTMGSSALTKTKYIERVTRN
ncbi:unnamed protein product [Leptosia nina]|uniref:YLP motif-containing protein 1 n=1 Tax=Leptosia nina TaxID=320188 RepID=A0AAV1J358_9NEOP